MSAPAAEALDVVRRFLAKARLPALLEAGEPEIPLTEGCYSLDPSPSGLRLHVWTVSRSYSRRITAVARQSPGRLELRFHRLGRPDGTLTLVDTAHGGMAEVRRRNRRQEAREAFRFALARQFPDWKLAELSTAPDLEHSLSPSYPRALLTRGESALAAIAAPDGALDPDGALPFGLIWLDYLRRRDRRRAIATLAVFLPEEHGVNTALRARLLHRARVDVALYLTHPDAGETRVDPADWGNLVTRLDPPPAARPATAPGPEAQLESAILADVRTLDAALLPQPVYRQAPAIAHIDRGILDLLAADRDGRLAVIELKVTQDVQLPLQALDYWMRVAWHLERGDFSRHGYFPGVALRSAPPLLYLAAPALEFHPTTATLVSFLSPSIPITCLGLGANWKEAVKVIHRQDRHEHHSATA